MWIRRLLMVVYVLVLAAAVYFGVQALRSLGHATVIVEWSTASELNTVGFNLNRSDTAEGEYVKINQELIPTGADPLTGSDYSYEDTDVEPGRTYFYRLEDVEDNGAVNSFGPIEVKAEAGGRWELLSAVLLALAGLGGLAALFLPPRRPDAASTEAPLTGEAPDPAG